MKICPRRMRLLLANTPFLKAALKFTLFFCAVAFLFLYFQVKKEKETLISLALSLSPTGEKSDDLVLPLTDTLILNGYAERNLKEKKENAFIVIVVTSSPENAVRRSIIRGSWMKQAHELGVAVVFFIGMPASDDMMASLSAENHQFQDLIIDDFRESYYALAIKTLRVLKYFKFHHPKTKFLVKTDDDVFVSVPNLVQYCFEANQKFAKKNNRDYFLGGVIHTGRGPHTWNAFSKWYAPAKLWEKVYASAMTFRGESEDRDNYPPYAEGNFYILSDDAALDILNVSGKVPLYHLEDVHVTGVMANWILKIEPEQVPLISSSSNMFPKLSYFWYKIFVKPKDILAFHCDNYVELITTLYADSRA